MMPTSGIVPVPCAAAAEAVVQLPADSKRISKLLGARARQDARRKVLEHVALGHGNRAGVQRKSLPLVGFTSLSVASLLSPVTAASPLMSIGAPSPSPLLGKLSPPPAARRSPRVEVEVTAIKERSWQCHSCTYEQDFVPGSRMCVMCNSTRRRLHGHGAPQKFFGESKPTIVRPGGRGKLYCPNCRLGDRCKACLLARREKSLNEDIWTDAKGPLK
jgi:hypothetical protein